LPNREKRVLFTFIPELMPGGERILLAGAVSTPSQFAGGKVVAPLDDITVIEVDNWMAAPSAGAVLADNGANVIKVEPLGGDPMRDKGRPAKIAGEAGDYDFQFDVDNRGKRSIALALDTSAGIEVLHKLIASADVFLCNLLTHRQQRFGLDPETLHGLNPGLVHATLTGYGTTGPDAWRPGYDVTAFFGRSGLYDAMREGEQGEVPMARPAQGDHTTGLALFGAMVSALRLRDRTGEGQIVETSLYETAVWTQSSDFGVTAVDNAPVRRRARHEMILPLANRYPCGDGHWLVLNMPDPSAWPKFCGVIGREDWLQDQRFETPKGRFQHMRELVDGIDAVLITKSRDEWGVIFDKEGLIWGPVLSLHEVSLDPQANAIGLFPTLSHELIGDYRTVNTPFRIHTADIGPKAPAPDLGQHSEEVLQQLGLTDDDIESLVNSGAIGNT
jgi:crotonobetainyl-CoA:carnitine CoA-transferase CaiB-like acyl-CoA transferase